MVVNAAGEGVEISEENFPDANFREFVKQYDTSGDGALSDAELAVVTQMETSYVSDSSKRIGDLTGIGIFSSLKKLDVQYTNVTSLDFSALGQLEEMELSDNNKLTEAAVISQSLKKLTVYAHANLESLDLSGCPALEEVNIYYSGKLKSVSVKNCSALKVFKASSISVLEEIDFTGCTALEELSLEKLPLLTSFSGSTYTGFSQCQALKSLKLTGNIELSDDSFSSFPALTSLSLSDNSSVESLDMGNLLTVKKLDLDTCSALEKVLLPDNDQLELADVTIESCEALTTMDLSNAKNLKVLDIYGAAIPTINCKDAPKLKKVDVAYDTELTSLSLEGSAVESCSLSNLTGLTSLNFKDCANLKSVNVSPNSRWEYVSHGEGYTVYENNNIESIDITGCVALENLVCTHQKLDSLDVSDCSKLHNLICSDNQLTSLDLSGCSELYEVNCASNKLSVLTPGKFVLHEVQNYYYDQGVITEAGRFNFSGNQLSAVSLKDGSIFTEFNCSDNKLTDLGDPAFYIQTRTENDYQTGEPYTVTEGGTLDCSKNELKSIKPEVLENVAYLVCTFNHISSLDLGDCENLKTADFENQTIVVDSVPCKFALSALGNSIDATKVSRIINCYQTGSEADFGDVWPSITVFHGFVNGYFYPDSDKFTYYYNTGVDNVVPFDPGGGLVVMSPNVKKPVKATTNTGASVLDEDGAEIDGNKWMNVTVIVGDGSVASAVTHELNDEGTHCKDCGKVAINEKNFPDKAFRNYISYQFDPDGDGYFDPTVVEDISINEGARDLTGLHYFTGLKYLNCCDLGLTSLDLSAQTELITLECAYNDFSAQDSLKLSACTKLTYIDCSHCRISSIDLSAQTELEKLDIFNNSLESLDISGCTLLNYINCSGNAPLSALSLDSTVLEFADCSRCNLSSFPTGLTGLTELRISGNEIGNLDLSDCTALKVIDCSDNTISSLSIDPGASSGLILPAMK